MSETGLTNEDRRKWGLVETVKGHWPKGCRRNQHDLSDKFVWKVLTQLVKGVETTGLYEEPTFAGAARFCKISSRTIRRWVDGEDWPNKRGIQKLEQYLKQYNT